MAKNEIVVVADDKKINAAINRINKRIEAIQRGYIEIVGDIAYLKETKAHEIKGYQSFYTFCQEKFGISRGMVHNLLTIYNRYGENYEIIEEARDMSCRQMLAQIKEEKHQGEAKKSTKKKKDKKKHETIVDFNFVNADEWSVNDLIEKLSEELGEAFIIPAGANVVLKITT